MANKSETKVTRIKADGAKPSVAKKSAPKAKKAPRVREQRERTGIFWSLIGYFKGAWYELRQVIWPTRQATWGLTIAVLGFSAFFVVFILLIDAGFKYLFELLLK